MSLTKTQIDALIDRNCKSNDISYPIADKTADENLALDSAIDILIKNSGKWQFDDTNQTDYPIIVANIVSGQRDYSFLTDGSGNLILGIYKVMVANSAGIFSEITPVDMQSDQGQETFYDGVNGTGIPTKYDKTGNGIFLDAIPNYDRAGGLKVFINREGSYFTTSDTTKKPGIPGLYHEYLALGPSVSYCKRNQMFALADRYQNDLINMEIKMKGGIASRAKDDEKVLSQTITPFI